MPKRKKDAQREDRIANEIVVDAYDSGEQAMGWYCYLQDNLTFPFTATCTAECSTSPLNDNDEVQVLAMADSDDCEHDMFVTIRWNRRKLAVPLAQLTPRSSAHARTKQAAADWHYWVEMGYEF